MESSWIAGWETRLVTGLREERFGEIAVAKGYLNSHTLEECLREHEALRSAGTNLRLGQLFLRHGYLRREELFEILSLQGRAIRRCRRCDRTYELSGDHSTGVPHCLKCGDDLATPERTEPIDPSPTLYSIVKDDSGTLRLCLGNYTLIREVARGGMADVFEAIDPVLKRRVALKILRKRGEATIPAQLNHPNIVAVHAVGTIDNSGGSPLPFIEMDFVEGRTFAAVLRDERVNRTERLRILLDVARAVGHAHERWIVHRDLKPANVLVEESGRVFLTDFGLCQTDRSEGALVGTPLYMSPEQIELSDIDARSDVWTLGVMLYEILVGHPPFSSESFGELSRQILAEKPSLLGCRTHPDLKAICLKALQKDRQRRYGNGSAFAQDLSRFLAGQAVDARPPTWTRAKAALALGAMGAIAALLAALLWFVGR